MITMASAIITPLSTEKAIRMIEQQNKLAFIIQLSATSKQVKDEIEKRFKVKVEKVNVMHDTMGRKKAYVKLTSDYSALDIATDLALI
jgi:ribosomal protein uL23